MLTDFPIKITIKKSIKFIFFNLLKFEPSCLVITEIYIFEFYEEQKGLGTLLKMDKSLRKYRNKKVKI